MSTTRTKPEHCYLDCARRVAADERVCLNCPLAPPPLYEVLAAERAKRAERAKQEEIAERRDNIVAIACSIADWGALDPVRLTSLQLAVEMLRNAETEEQT